MSRKKAPAQVVGNIGMYYAAYRLSQMGWNVMPTARNARGIDLLAYNSSAEKYLGIQIKALSKRNAVPLGNSLDKVMGDWWIIVTKAVDEPVCYVLSPKEIKKLAHRNENAQGTISYWLEPNSYDRDKFCEAWDRIGRSD